MQTKQTKPQIAGKMGHVKVWREEVELETYMPLQPEKHPAFLDKRVYQGSSGAVYPLPVTTRIADSSRLRKWAGIWLENRYVRVLILPEIGGRIHIIQDLTTGYDVIYRQNVIKPALVGLAGPWISGGIEFNWPQHHRPATFMPTDVEIEHHDDGSITVWCSDHDPITRMKGMHGVCIHPGSAAVHLKVRVRNRTPLVQSFLWWANAATRVHEQYQSFFPPDVTAVADHARRATSTFPLCNGIYYGVNYGERAMNGVPGSECPNNFVPPACRSSIDDLSVKYPPNDLSWYANIPVPTSYMCIGSRYGFFGGYDHKIQAGIVHYADPAISPGKKQWTWGNHEFGYAWDRNLTDADGPYIELMAGVFTDNQPDFSWLMPGETRVWDQYWYPIQKIGPATFANQHAALSIKCDANSLQIGICVAAEQASCTVTIQSKGNTLFSSTQTILPGAPFIKSIPFTQTSDARGIRAVVTTKLGEVLINHSPEDIKPVTDVQAAEEPPLPEEIESNDELYLTGLHLQQYRHATRSPAAYWQEALRRDPDDSRCCTAMAELHLKRGKLEKAEELLKRAVKRLTKRNANPLNGEAHYLLGLVLRCKADRLAPNDPQAEHLITGALEAFRKAAWNQPWTVASQFCAAQLHCRRHQWLEAVALLESALRHDDENTSVLCLLTLALRRLNRINRANSHLHRVRAFDMVDRLSWFINSGQVMSDAQTGLDIAHELAEAGLTDWAVTALTSLRAETDRESSRDLPTQTLGTEPLLYYTLAWLCDRQGNQAEASSWRQRAQQCNSDCCFPARLVDYAVLTSAIAADEHDSRAHWLLGCLLYSWRRYDEAIVNWNRAADLNKNDSRVWRCLGMAYFNVQGDHVLAANAYQQAVLADASDARICYEQDQLWKRIGRSPAERLQQLQPQVSLVLERDDLTVEYCSLLSHSGAYNKAVELLRSRAFQPWEGGEGMVLAQWVRAQLALGRIHLKRNEPALAEAAINEAIYPPANLSEARHLLANASDAWYWYGCALEGLRRDDEAKAMFQRTADFRGDFQEMSVQAFSEMTYYSALAMRKLNREPEAHALLHELRSFGEWLEQAPAVIDYFATSLPTMLLFNTDIQAAQQLRGQFLQAQALYGLGHYEQAELFLHRIISQDPSHAGATDLLAELQPSKEVSL